MFFLEFKAQHPNDPRGSPKGLEQFVRWVGVHLDHRHRSLAVTGPAEGHVGNVHRRATERGADRANDARAVVIFDKQEFAGWVRFDVMSGDVNNPGRFTKKRSSDRADLFALDGGDLDEFRAIRRKRCG